MNTNTKITDLNHEDLVDLFSTAFYGSLNFAVTYDKKAKDNIKVEENDCFEDVMAKIVKDGNGNLIVYDENAEDGEVYGNCHCGTEEIDDEIITTYYYIGINEITKGLEAAANSSKDYIRKAFNAFVNREEDSEWDAVTADILMQMIVFGEVIYG